MDRVTGRKWIGYYKERVRKLLPIGERIRAKDLIKMARNQCMSPNKVYECLKIMENDREIRTEKDRPKEAFYIRFEDTRIKNLIDNFFTELNITLAEMPEEVKTMRNGVMNFAADFVKGSNLPQKEQEKVIKEIDRRSVGRTAYYLLLKHAFETIKTIEPELKNEEFYVDSDGSFVPKDWVDKKIGYRERNDWLTQIYNQQTK